MEATTAVVDVNAEAKRILAVSIGKLYASRGQRGGLGLHRGLLLSLVMRSARDIYHAAAYAQAVAVAAVVAAEEAMDTAKHAAEEAMDTAKNAEEVEDESGSSAPPSGSGAPPPGNSSTTTEPEKVELECTEEGGEEDTIKAEVSSSRTDTRWGEDKKEKEDKENMNPRKRRGKASVAPDFLPSKKARLEEEEEQPAEERRHHQGPAVVPGGLGAASCRVPPHPFSALNRPAVIPAC